jgi:hypothetical protein
MDITPVVDEKCCVCEKMVAKYEFTIRCNSDYICDSCLQALLMCSGNFSRSDWE